MPRPFPSSFRPLTGLSAIENLAVTIVTAQSGTEAKAALAQAAKALTGQYRNRRSASALIVLVCGRISSSRLGA